jgi:anti-sigma regulatory factor (Ser/Thr protein kinase)
LSLEEFTYRCDDLARSISYFVERWGQFLGDERAGGLRETSNRLSGSCDAEPGGPVACGPRLRAGAASRAPNLEWFGTTHVGHGVFGQRSPGESMPFRGLEFMSADVPLSLELWTHDQAPRRAREYLDKVTARVPLSEDRRGDMLLLASEVVSNAVRHGTTPIELRVELGDVVRVMVEDSGPGEPTISHRTVGGWGLRLVDELAACWGVLRTNPGKVVWFELPLD